MSAIIGLLAASLVSTIISAGLSYYSANQNVLAQQDINAQNIQAQKDINAQNIQAQSAINQQNIDYSREFAQNGIQWRMADLEAAGLNPVMAASGGSASSPIAMSAPTSKAAMQTAPQLDLSGVGSALNAMTNMMYASYFMSQRNDIQSDRNDIMSDKNKVLDNLYKRKAAYMNDAQYVNHAKQINKILEKPQQALNKQGIKLSDKEWQKMLDELKHI